MFAVGHFALGYLVGKLGSKFLNVPINLPLLFLASVFPDVDIMVPFLVHRGPLHSVLVLCLLFVPLFLVYGKRAVPYFFALISHSLIGDYLTGDLQLLWPVSSSLYGLTIGIESLFNIGLEWLLFAVSVVVMFKTKDLQLLFQRDSSNLILIIPLMTVLLPALLTFPLYIPLVLFVPHVFYLGVFVFSIFITLK